MILLFRLIKCLITSRFRPRIDVLGESVFRMRVWPNDLDLNMHVNSGRYGSFMDIGRVDLFVRMRVFRQVIRRGWRPINAATMISHRKSLLPFERFTVRTRILCWDEKWLYFEHLIERQDGELAAVANARGLLRGRDGNVAPPALLELVGQPGLPSPPMPLYIARWREAEAAR
ncbi:MAG TPA: acyl-CoA thioesterase [Thermoanaerobaculia bacterium]|nr:acyl-CoA thioesterase [Thermoanaerobaculia bacterium]